jgi:PAS domain S-box-containing protein
MAIVRDITEQVFDEQRLIFQSLLLKQSLSATDVVDKNGLFTYVNDAYVKMWGYNTKDEIIGTSPLSHCVDESTPQTIIDKVEEDGEFILQFKAKKKNGSEFDALMAVKSVYYLDEKLYIASTMDISEKEKMREDNLNQEKILYQQSKMAAMGEMLENIAHQWRQPLSTISTLATGSKLQKEMNCLSDSELDMAFDTINNSAQYLSETIEDFRSFFDPSNNKISEFLLSNTIEKTLSILESQFKINDIKIIRNIEDITVFSIENELIQVLVNLLNNSRDALLNLKEEKRYIFIDIYEDKEDFIIEIKDNAKGIAIDIIDRIFEPYFTTKHKAQGTGIGLYMSEEIIKTHLNGTLLVNNETYEYDGNICVGVKFSIRIKIKA